MSIRTNRLLLICVCICVELTCISAAKDLNEVNDDQVSSFISALWSEPLHSIDLVIYKQVTVRPVPIEVIRQQVSADASKLSDIQKKGGNRVIVRGFNYEDEVNSRFKAYNQPRLLKEHIYISDNGYRLDQTVIKNGLGSKDESEVQRTYVNCGDKGKGDYTHFVYDNALKQAVIDNNKGTVWREHRADEWLGVPKSIGAILKAKLSVGNGNSSGIAVPDNDKIRKLLSGGNDSFKVEISNISYDKKPASNISFVSKRNGRTDFALVTDRNNYSNVYSLKMYDTETGGLTYQRDTKDFDEKGFPRQVSTKTFNRKGVMIEEETVVVHKVKLNPELPKELFEFKVPPGYTLIDSRLNPALIINPDRESSLSMESTKNYQLHASDSVATNKMEIKKSNGGLSISNVNTTTKYSSLYISKKSGESTASTGLNIYSIVMVLVSTGVLVIIALAFKSRKGRTNF